MFIHSLCFWWVKFLNPQIICLLLTFLSHIFMSIFQLLLNSLLCNFFIFASVAFQPLFNCSLSDWLIRNLFIMVLWTRLRHRRKILRRQLFIMIKLGIGNWLRLPFIPFFLPAWIQNHIFCRGRPICMLRRLLFEKINSLEFVFQNVNDILLMVITLFINSIHRGLLIFVLIVTVTVVH